MAMDQRSAFLLELLDKLGVPLMEAVQAHAQTDAANAAQEAGTLAALLGQSVQLGLSVAQKLDIRDGQGDADAIRLSLSAMAAKLVGETYRLQGRIPGEADTARLTRALEAVITFADNFTPSAEHTARLRTAGAEKPVFDQAQSQVFYLSAMEPVLGAIAEFPFGQNETKLTQDTAVYLQQRAASLREAMIGASAEPAESSFAELMILHSLARMYADCHRHETARILSRQENGDAVPSLDTVWNAFDVRLAMLETLLNVAVPGEAPGTSMVSPISTAQAAPIEQRAAAQVQPDTQSPSPPPAQPEEYQPVPDNSPEPPSAPPAAGPGGPMGFFASKKADDDTQTPAPPAAEASPPGNPGSPMSFFKSGGKKDDETGG